MYEKGILTGSFDIIHPGYIKLFEEAKSMCKTVVVALNKNGKRKPVFSVKERRATLLAIKYVDKVITYSTEDELYELLKSELPHVRILGNDYLDKPYTGKDLNQEVYYHDRSFHGWSTTKVIEEVKKR